MMFGFYLSNYFGCVENEMRLNSSVQFAGVYNAKFVDEAGKVPPELTSLNRTDRRRSLNSAMRDRLDSITFPKGVDKFYTKTGFLILNGSEYEKAEPLIYAEGTAYDNYLDTLKPTGIATITVQMPTKKRATDASPTVVNIDYPA